MPLAKALGAFWRGYKRGSASARQEGLEVQANATQYLSLYYLKPTNIQYSFFQRWASFWLIWLSVPFLIVGVIALLLMVVGSSERTGNGVGLVLLNGAVLGMPIHAICLYRRRRSIRNSILNQNRVRRTIGDFTLRVDAEGAVSLQRQSFADRLAGIEVPSLTHSLKWPQVCASCAACPATTKVVAFNGMTAYGKVHTEAWPIPYCSRCKDKEGVRSRTLMANDVAVWLLDFDILGSSRVFMFKNHEYGRLFSEANKVVLVCSVCRTPLDHVDPFCSTCHLAHPAGALNERFRGPERNAGG